jgi:transmembrane 9 superfamily protein 3
MVSKLLLLLLLNSTSADEHSHTYKPLDQVVVWVDTVGPQHNTQETYAYSQLPYCSPPPSKLTLEHHHETLGYA